MTDEAAPLFADRFAVAGDDATPIGPANRRDVADLYRQHAPQAARFATLLLGSDADAWDVVHEAFLRTAGRVLTLRSPDSFGAYLRRAVLREVQQRHRSSGRREARETRAHAQSAPSRTAADTAGTEGVRVDMRRALLALPPQERAAVILRYWLDLPEADMAIALGCRAGTVKSRLSRGLATLRTVIGDD